MTFVSEVDIFCCSWYHENKEVKNVYLLYDLSIGGITSGEEDW